MTNNMTTVSGTPTFDATNGLDAAIMSAAAAADLFLGAASTNIGTGTIEFFFKGTYGSATAAVCVAGRWGWIGVISGKLASKYGAANVTLQPATNSTVNGNTRIHCAIQFVNGAGSLYCNGLLIATVATVGVIAASPNVPSLRGFASGSSPISAGNLVQGVRVSTIARYPTGPVGTTYTVPTSYTLDANTAALWLLTTDGSDSQTGAVTTPPTIGTISVATAAGNDTITYPAPVAGTNAVGGVSLYEGTTSGGESLTAVATNTAAVSGTFVRTTPAVGQKFYYVRAFDSGGVVTFSTNSNEVSTGAAPTVNVLPTDASIVYSPATWDVTSARALCNSPGYLRVAVAGGVSAISAVFDVANLSPIVPQIAYRVDDGPWTVVNVAATVTIPLDTLSTGGHVVEIQIKATTQASDRWGSPYLTAVKFKGFSVPTGGTVTAPDVRALVGLFFGDSIVEGVNTITTLATNDVDNNDSRLSFAYQAGKALGAEIGQIGYGRWGVTVAGNGNVPAGNTVVSSIASGLTRVLPTAPDFVWINVGTNDQRQSTTSAAFQTALISFINTVLAATPATCMVFVQIPFGLHYGTTPYIAAVAACNTPARVKFVDTTGWWSTGESGDTLHPYGTAGVRTLGLKVAAAIRTGLKRGQQYRVQPDGTTLKVITPQRV